MKKDASLLQKCGALAYLLFFTAGFYCWALYGLLWYYGNIYIRATLALYSAYIWFGPGRRAPQTGSTPPLLRRSPIWKYSAEYCPMSLHKTAELPPDGNYVLGFHPHGIISYSAFVAFATEALDVSKTFPGITFHLLTLVQNFYVPFIRDLTLWHGICDCARHTCLNLLTGGKGKAIILCVGGAREALLAEPNTFEIVLGRRTGFVKVAVETGAALVPVISFGENNMFHVTRPDKNSLAARVQTYLLKAVGLGFPIFHGTGMMVSSVGLLPYQGPIQVVVGAPIQVPKLQGSIDSDEGRRVVHEVHQAYVDGLRQIWRTYKDRFALGRKGTMRIVDALPVPDASAVGPKPE